MSGKVTKKFNPNEHLRTFERRQRQLDGSYKTVGIDYLDVKWRLVWFRQEHPNGSIQTDLLSAPGVTPAVVRATVTLENGVTSLWLVVGAPLTHSRAGAARARRRSSSCAPSPRSRGTPCRRTASPCPCAPRSPCA